MPKGFYFSACCCCSLPHTLGRSEKLMRARVASVSRNWVGRGLRAGCPTVGGTGYQLSSRWPGARWGCCLSWPALCLSSWARSKVYRDELSRTSLFDLRKSYLHRCPWRRLHEQPRPRERSLEVGTGFGEVSPPFGVEANHMGGAQDVGGFCGIR